MGFADVAPDTAKVLVVHFTHEKQAFMVTLEEQVEALLVEFYKQNILANMTIKSLEWLCRREPRYLAAATLCKIG